MDMTGKQHQTLSVRAAIWLEEAFPSVRVVDRIGALIVFRILTRTLARLLRGLSSAGGQSDTNIVATASSEDIDGR